VFLYELISIQRQKIKRGPALSYVANALIYVAKPLFYGFLTDKMKNEVRLKLV